MGDNLREQFFVGLVKELLGPKIGMNELLEIRDTPWDDYQVGVLAPEKAQQIKDIGSDDLATSETGEEDIFSEDDALVAAPNGIIDPKNRPKSLGVSFVVDEKTDQIAMCVTWARYKKEDRAWKRKSQRPWIQTVKITSNGTQKFQIYKGNDGNVELSVTKRLAKSGKQANAVITVALVNRLDVSSNGGMYPSNAELSESSIFQPHIRIKILGGVLLSFDSLEMQHAKNAKTSESLSENTLEFLYRNQHVKARGHLCSATWKEIDYEKHLSTEAKNSLWPDIYGNAECKDFEDADVKSEFLPLYAVPTPEFRHNLSAKELSESGNKKELERLLNKKLVEPYKDWVRNSSGVLDAEEYTDKRVKDKIKIEMELLGRRMESGLQMLETEEKVHLAFCFANKVMDLQYRWSHNGDGLEWRDFQVAFLLAEIEPIVNKDSKQRNVVDLIWMPTGGGKTEAYLLVMAFTIALRRLSVEHRDEEGDVNGVSIITRYTLRLLTIQQFRRTANMITAAEYLRTMTTEKGIGWRPNLCNIKGDFIYGSARFSIGLWVGHNVTPSSPEEAIAGIENGAKDTGADAAQMLRCPACGSWLSIPEKLEENSEIYILVKGVVEKPIVEEPITNNNPTVLTVIPSGDGSFTTLKIQVNASENRPIERFQLENSLKKLINKTSKERLEFLSISTTSPGYFAMDKEARKKEKEDFEVYCPNPDCTLNKNVKYVEGVYAYREGQEGEKNPDGLYVRKIANPTFYGKRVPIPVYTTDEQVYAHCPTIVIGTVDKIARLAYDPMASCLFGSVIGYDPLSGFVTLKKASKNVRKKYVPLKNGFKPPELIVQDELHLLEGPLGSLFGLYETVVDGLIQLKGGKPKYIAATATISNAELQVKNLFGRDVLQFPPNGPDINSNFFSEVSGNDGWNENKQGRIYIGVCMPGVSSQRALTRIFAALKIMQYKNHDSSAFKYYWTLVGYFNALKELGGAESVYKGDVWEYLKSTSEDTEKKFDPQHYLELSSKMSSVGVHQLLDKLENEGKTNSEEIRKNTEMIFATSMFGTGVDVSHLSLMLVDGQPKLNAQYIQATGRVGREHGGLVITFFRATRPRDLNHYELFAGYHSRFHMVVEPASVAPFAEGTMAKASGPAIVSFLRNLPKPSTEWYLNDGKVVLGQRADKDITLVLKSIKSRLTKIYQATEDQVKIINYIDSQINSWKAIAKECSESEKLLFSEPSIFHGKRHHLENVVLGDQIHEMYGLKNGERQLKVVYKDAPTSLRNVEETLSFTLPGLARGIDIRRSQFLFSYGPGAIMEAGNVTAIVPEFTKDGLSGGLRTIKQNEYKDVGSANMKMAISDHFNSDLTLGKNNVKLFLLPATSGGEPKYKTHYFPEWRICHNNHSINGYVLYKTNDKYKINNNCPVCNDSKKSTQVRFITACKNGHLDDVDWESAVSYGDRHSRDGYTEWYYWKVTSGSDAEIKRPGSEKGTTLKQIYRFYNSENHKPSLKCKSRYIEQEGDWEKERRPNNKNCEEKAEVTLKQSSAVYMPETLSLISVPKNSDEEILEKDTEKNRLIIELFKENPAKIDEIKKDYGEAIASLLLKGQKEGKLDEYIKFLQQKPYSKLLVEEFNALSEIKSHKDLKIGPPVNIDFPINKFKMSVYPVEKLKVLTALVGYRRISGTEGKLVSTGATDDDENQWYPIVEGSGEGIFLTFEEKKIPEPLREQLEKYETVHMSKDSDEMNGTNANRSLFVWLHTLSHALIRKISLFAGYSLPSLRERVYINSLGQDSFPDSGGILIYTPVSGWDGSMGGLTELVKSFQGILDSTVLETAFCPNDPLCSTIEKKKDSKNGAACYGCLMLPETSCAYRNMYLDRHVLNEGGSQ